MITLNLDLLKTAIKLLAGILFLYFILTIPINHKMSVNLHSLNFQDTIGDWEKNNITLQYK